MRLRAALIALVVAGIAGGIVYLAQQTESASGSNASPTTTANVADGFRGEVHPLLTGKTQLKVTAHWSQVGKGRDQIDRVVPKIYSWFTSLKPAQAEMVYTERDFSAFLPEAVGEVGQTWAIEPEKVLTFLKQFHPRPSMHVVAQGRRAGPDGVFGVLRGVSPDRLDIAFRAHAEFYLTPPDWPATEMLIKAWYTPAYLTGRMVVNRRTGTVEYFRFALPTEKSLNVHLTAAFKDRDLKGDAHDIVRVERMELVGGDAAAAEKPAWTKSLTQTETDRKLARVFYKFHEINFLPFDQVAGRAREQGKPVFAIVSWGSFDDQSC